MCDVEHKETSKHASFSNKFPPLSFPSRLKKKDDEQQFCKFWNILKQFYINISFIDVLEQMLSYVKFLKDILAKKQRLNEYETIALM